MAVDALERVTNLLALLLETQRPLTLDEIASELDGYSHSTAALRGAFERDKALLREAGVPIDTVVLSGERSGATAYRIDRDRYELRGLELTTEEQHALQLAVATVRSGDARFGLLKLGGSNHDDAAVVANVPALDALPTLREAAAARATVRFEYRSTMRDVQPYALLLREGFWYVIGHDAGHDEVRTFRVDRIAGDVAVGDGASFVRPEGFDARDAFPTDPKQLADGDGDVAEMATVLIDAGRAALAIDELGEASIVERRPDGAVVVDVACANLGAFRSWLFGFGLHAEILRPPDVRAAVVAWLEAMAPPSHGASMNPAPR